MKTRILKIFLLVGLIVGINSCLFGHPIVSDEMNEDFLEMFKVNDMNEHFSISVNNSDDSNLRYGSNIDIVVYNKSKQEIYFPPDSSMKLFVVRENTWIEIENFVTYGDELILLPNGSLFGDTRSTLVNPVLLPDMDKKVDERDIVRVAMIGELLSSGNPTGTLVGAYTDIEMISGD